MTNPFERIEELSKKARMETVPTVDVSQDVMRRIRTLRAENQASENSFFWFAVGSVCTASVTLLFSVSLLNLLTDPLAFLFQTYSLSLF